ncbi:hypothetical protein [Streptomyces sp. GS7]|uniref:hypothetical protein n=1 Tax=Streptomyces sp. GS7 TaxID=2692234 RepID=UPI0013174FA9|nr:hypothetical protein [Streptomyces sp. GS7]QHC23363.1 hypothetical protein GR130_20165 [Streptomyces sp. GS7]
MGPVDPQGLSGEQEPPGPVRAAYGYVDGFKKVSGYGFTVELHGQGQAVHYVLTFDDKPQAVTVTPATNWGLSAGVDPRTDKEFNVFIVDWNGKAATCAFFVIAII